MSGTHVPDVSAGEAAEKALAALVKLLESPDVNVRMQAADILLGYQK